MLCQAPPTSRRWLACHQARTLYIYQECLRISAVCRYIAAHIVDTYMEWYTYVHIHMYANAYMHTCTHICIAYIDVFIHLCRFFLGGAGGPKPTQGSEKGRCPSHKKQYLHPPSHPMYRYFMPMSCLMVSARWYEGCSKGRGLDSHPCCGPIFQI